MVQSLELHRLTPRSYWGLAVRVNLVLLAHNLIRSEVLLLSHKGHLEDGGGGGLR